MELDKRIIKGKKPFDCVDAESETVKSFIGKRGYFANHISEFIDISDLEEDVLTAINPDEPDCEVYKATCTTWEYFLPAEWVKEPEKTYRPYTVMEFIKEYPLGSHLHFRLKNDSMEMHRLIDGYNDCLNGAGTLFICGAMYSMSELYNNYDIFKDGEWHKFGVEE